MPLSLPIQFLVATIAGWINRAQQDVIEYLRAENAILLEHLGGRVPRLTDGQRRRLAIRGEVLGRAVLSRVASIVTPDTILRWYRNLVARKYDGSVTRRRSIVRESVTDALLRFCRESPTWGYTRLRDALYYVGRDVSRETVRRILNEHGIEPAPERGRRLSWRTFLRAHWPRLAAADFFTVEVVTWRGLVRYFVFFVMELKTRRVEIAGITRDPDEAWMKQIARNLSDAGDGFLRGLTHLILDRDPLFTAGFRKILKDSGVKVVRL